MNIKSLTTLFSVRLSWRFERYRPCRQMEDNQLNRNFDNHVDPWLLSILSTGKTLHILYRILQQVGYNLIKNQSFFSVVLYSFSLSWHITRNDPYRVRLYLKTKIGAFLPCSRSSDSGDSAKRKKQENTTGVGREGEFHNFFISVSFLRFFSVLHFAPLSPIVSERLEQARTFFI